MKTLLKIGGTVAVLAAVFAFATSAFAQGPGNSAAPAGGSQTPVNLNAADGIITIDESVMHAAIAEALGISVDELETALAAGETPATLALALGVDYAEVQAAMDAVYAAAVAQAVTDGLITQEQADWLLSHQGRQNGQQGSGGAGSGYDGDCPTVAP